MKRASKGIFAAHAGLFRSKGFWPRPVIPGKKQPPIKTWQRPDPEIPPSELDSWLKTYATYGIGLVMGSPFPDGTSLGALDIDRDEYVAPAREVLGNPPCGRFGSKGAVFFVRVASNIRNAKFRIKGEGSKAKAVAECLFHRSFCVIPPTIHPDTYKPYRWIGTPLHEIEFLQLPLVGE